MLATIKKDPARVNAGAVATTGGNPVSQSQDIPVGLCQCGCGRKTGIAADNRPERQQVKGRPVRFAPGHNNGKTNSGELFSVEDRGFDTPCWMWQRAILGAGKSSGYGLHRVDGIQRRAHRWMYEREIGPIPDALQLDHLCGNRACVNPAHLEPVSNAENSRRGRGTKLTAESVADIKARRESDTSYALAAEYGVSDGTIRSAWTGKSWRDVKPRRRKEQTND